MSCNHWQHIQAMSAEPAYNLIKNQEDYEDVEMYRDISIPDSIAQAFNKQYPIQAMLDKEQFNTKHFFSYAYQGLNYTATLRNYKFGPEGKNQLTIKLSYDGFRYSKRKFKKHHVKWHGLKNFFLLAPDVLDEIPFIKSLGKTLDCKMIFYYSIRDRRMDIRFNCNGTYVLMITFEHGYPEDIPSSEFYY